MSAIMIESNPLIQFPWNGLAGVLDPLSPRTGSAGQEGQTSETTRHSLTAIAGRRGVVAALQLPRPDDMPRLILSISPCRSGTTVMLRVMGAMGVESHFQPLKNVLRWRLEGEIRPWRLAAGARRTVYLKETLGPYTFAEATFNPLQLLLEAGVPAAKLHILIHGRHPLATWASWQKWWRGQTTLDYLLAAYQTTEKIRQQALATNLAITTLVYEAFDQISPTAVVKQLARRLQVPFTEKAISQWATLPAFGPSQSNVVLPEEPARFITPGIHDRVHQAKAFVFHPVPTKTIATIAPYDRECMRRAGLFALYDRWQGQCAADLLA